jgi:hypothetical protein
LFTPNFRNVWEQGQHLAVVGPTGVGKTHLSRSLLQARDYVVVLAVKPKDDTLEIFDKPMDGLPRFRTVKKWPPRWGSHHVVLDAAPASLDPEDIQEQRETVYNALSDIFKSGGWCVDFDDLSYVANTLHMRPQIEVFLNQGRSNHNSVVSCVTRPRRVPTEAFNQTSHIIMFAFDDDADSKRAAEIAGLNWPTMRSIQRDLAPRDFVTRNRASRDLMIVRHNGGR